MRKMYLYAVTSPVYHRADRVGRAACGAALALTSQSNSVPPYQGVPRTRCPECFSGKFAAPVVP